MLVTPFPGEEEGKNMSAIRRVMSLVDVVKMTQVALKQQEEEEERSITVAAGPTSADGNRDTRNETHRQRRKNTAGTTAALSRQKRITRGGTESPDAGRNGGDGNRALTVQGILRRSGGGGDYSHPPPSSSEEAHPGDSDDRTRRLERELSELSERTRAALESSWAEIADLRGERSARAAEARALEAELARLKKLRETNIRERCGELAVGPPRSETARGAAAAADGKHRMPRCSSAPDLEELRELRIKSRKNASISAASATASSNGGNDGVPRSQSCLSFPRLTAVATTPPSPHLLSPSGERRYRTNRRRRRSLTELVSKGIAGIQDQLQQNQLVVPERNSFIGSQGSHLLHSRRRRSNLEELHNRLAEAESSKLRTLYALSDKLRRKERQLAEAADRLRSLKTESERIRSQVRKVPRLVGDQVRKAQRERGELLAEMEALAESVRGKERQMRYLAVGIGEQMAALASATTTSKEKGGANGTSKNELQQRQ